MKPIRIPGKKGMKSRIPARLLGAVLTASLILDAAGTPFFYSLAPTENFIAAPGDAPAVNLIFQDTRLVFRRGLNALARRGKNRSRLEDTRAIRAIRVLFEANWDESTRRAEELFEMLWRHGAPEGRAGWLTELASIPAAREAVFRYFRRLDSPPSFEECMKIHTRLCTGGETAEALLAAVADDAVLRIRERGATDATDFLAGCRLALACAGRHTENGIDASVRITSVLLRETLFREEAAPIPAASRDFVLELLSLYRQNGRDARVRKPLDSLRGELSRRLASNGIPSESRESAIAVSSLIDLYLDGLAAAPFWFRRQTEHVRADIEAKLFPSPPSDAPGTESVFTVFFNQARAFLDQGRTLTADSLKRFTRIRNGAPARDPGRPAYEAVLVFKEALRSIDRARNECRNALLTETRLSPSLQNVDRIFEAIHAFERLEKLLDSAAGRVRSDRLKIAELNATLPVPERVSSSLERMFFELEKNFREARLATLDQQGAGCLASGTKIRGDSRITAWMIRLAKQFLAYDAARAGRILKRLNASIPVRSHFAEGSPAHRRIREWRTLAVHPDADLVDELAVLFWKAGFRKDAIERMRNLEPERRLVLFGRLHKTSLANYNERLLSVFETLGVENVPVRKEWFAVFPLAGATLALDEIDSRIGNDLVRTVLLLNKREHGMLPASRKKRLAAEIERLIETLKLKGSLPQVERLVPLPSAARIRASESRVSSA
jgi:hypothetical protein